jgi:hypothetical protein
MLLLHEFLTEPYLHICYEYTFVICLNSGNCPVMRKHFICHDINTISKHVYKSQ